MSEPRHAPATARNREAIFAVLQRVLPSKGLLLEIASGTGEHAAFMAPQLAITWQPTDGDPAALSDIDAHAKANGANNIRTALHLDVVTFPWPVAHADALFCCNMIHIAPWEAAEGLFAGAAQILPAGAPLILYGPFRRHGEHTAPSNVQFEEWLKAKDARFGVRDLDGEVTALAARNGFQREEIVPMPANNLTVVFRRTASA